MHSAYCIPDRHRKVKFFICSLHTTPSCCSCKMLHANQPLEGIVINIHIWTQMYSPYSSHHEKDTRFHLVKQPHIFTFCIRNAQGGTIDTITLAEQVRLIIDSLPPEKILGAHSTRKITFYPINSGSSSSSSNAPCLRQAYSSLIRVEGRDMHIAAVAE